MAQVLILRRSKPLRPRAFDFTKLFEPPLEDRIQEGLSKRLPSQSVVVGQDWTQPRDFDVLVAMVEIPQKVDPLEDALSLRPITKPKPLLIAKVPEKFKDAYWEVIDFARDEGKTVIWLGVEWTPQIPMEMRGFHWWLEPKVVVQEKTLEEDLDKLADVIENPSGGTFSEVVKGTGSSTTEEPAESTTVHQPNPKFHVFLCHNSADKPLIRAIAKRLASRGIRYWLDEEESQPGTDWQDLLETQIESIQAAAVFVGPSGVGPWHNRELKAFINEFVDRQCRVIPVILEGVHSVPKLPLFFKQLTWVDFRNKEPDPLKLLIWGITGERP